MGCRSHVGLFELGGSAVLLGPEEVRKGLSGGTLGVIQWIKLGGEEETAVWWIG